MIAFDYIQPDSLAQAGAFLRQNPDARALSGGMTLLPAMKLRMAAPSHLVDLSRLPELQGLRREGERLVIGAATRHAELASSALVGAAIPALCQLAGLIADPQVRNRGTIGGSVANNDPAADYPAAVLGLGATVVTDLRQIDADDFFLGIFDTLLQPGEIVTALSFPVPQRAAYAKYRHAASGYAIAGVFIAQWDSVVRVAVTGAGPGVFRWHQAEQALQQDCSPGALSGLHIDPDKLLDEPQAPAAWRANLVEVMTRRALAGLSQNAAASPSSCSPQHPQTGPAT